MPPSRTLARLVATLALLALVPVAGASGSATATGGTSLPGVTRIADPVGDAFLVVPAACHRRSCPLLLVAHRRGGRASDALDGSRHPTLQRFLSRFTGAGFALLLTDDGGPHTWGNASALAHARRVWEAARTRFRYGGETFALGVSMGGLPAALLGLTGTVPVRGLVLVAPRLNLADAYLGADLTRAAEIERAYGFGDAAAYRSATRGHDPVNDFGLFGRRPPPALVVASPEDRTVPLGANGAAFLALVSPLAPASRLLAVPGAHLGGTHLSDRVAQTAIAFLSGLRVARAPASAQRPNSRRDNGEPRTSSAIASGTPRVTTYSTR